jgi:hypothetical protein
MVELWPSILYSVPLVLFGTFVYTWLELRRSRMIEQWRRENTQSPVERVNWQREGF